MNRNVLIVTPYFAPQTHGAVFRAYQLAKYLPIFDLKSYVLTVDSKYSYHEDESLLNDLSSEVEIITSRYIEPTLRSLRMALGGKNRTLAQKVKEKTKNGNEVLESRKHQRGYTFSFYQYLLNKYCYSPDAWFRLALKIARKLTAEQDTKIVYTTCVSYTCNLIGKALQANGHEWVAVFRIQVVTLSGSPPVLIKYISGREELKKKRSEGSMKSQPWLHLMQ